jgi:multidrug transporter EmrE-like cation transporter
MKNMLLIIFSVLLGVAGQITLKHGVVAASHASGSRIEQSLDAGSLYGFLRQAAANKFVILGFLLYVFSSVGWLVILTRLDLSFAYPMISIGYIVVVILSKYVFHEPVGLARIAGTLLVCVGVLLISLTMRS